MSCAQVVPVEDLPLGPGGAELAGDRFGLLTAVRVVEKSKSGNRWLLRCECGRYAVRTVAALRQALRENQEPQCAECFRELRTGTLETKREGRRALWSRVFELNGSLYTEHSDALHKAQITKEVAASLGFEPDLEQPRLPVEIMPAPIAKGRSRHGQRAAFLVPLNGRRWKCCLCHQLFSDGFGCMACLEVSCLPCVRLELHHCNSRNKDWERCMTPERLAKLACGEPLGRGVKSVIQPYLPDSERRRLVASFTGITLKEPKERRAKVARKRVTFDWTAFRYGPSDSPEANG